MRLWVLWPNPPRRRLIHPHALDRHLAAGWILADGIPPQEPQPVTTSNERTMSQAQADAVATWLRSVANSMRLRDWVLHLRPEPPSDETAWASVQVIDSYTEANIWVDAQLLREPEDQIVETLIHELAHLYLGDIWDAMNVATHQIEGDEAKHWKHVLHRYVEAAVNAFALALADHLSYPSTTPMRNAPPRTTTTT